MPRAYTIAGHRGKQEAHGTSVAAETDDIGGIASAGVTQPSRPSPRSRPPVSVSIPPYGEQRFGRYEVEGELGRGGMSVVYRAHDPSLDRAVAVKVLHPHLADRNDARVRFAREARAVARLPHPNIVEVYDHAPADSERAYIVTELIDGPTLRAFVDAHPIRFGEVAALLMIPVLEALHHAHRAGIVHRDVKPENIMLRADGTPVLMDFGIAQMVDQDTLTATGTMLGSPAHMAPEIVEGEEITTLADVFSVGTVLYWLVCGALPFSAPSPAALFRRIAECRYDPVLHRKPQAGRQIARLIEQCMAHDPVDRPPSSGAIAQALRDLLAEGGISDPAAELVAFLNDPEVYQDALGRRLVPAYVGTAEQAYADGKTARALDYLDRALAIEDDHEGARALLARIERGRRYGRAWKLAGVCAAAALAAGVVVALIPTPDPDAPAAPTTIASLESVPSAEPATEASAQPAVAMASTPSSAAPRSAESTASASAASTSVASAAPATKAPASVASKAPRSKAPVSVAARPPRSNRPRRPRSDAPRSTAPETVASAAPETGPATMMTIQAKSPLAGGTTVFVDDQHKGNAAMLLARGGFTLPTGKSYRLKFVNKGCLKADERVINLPAGRTGSLIVTHDCRFKPAFLKVESNLKTGVFTSTGAPLGETNAQISINMQAPRRALTILVGPRDKQKERQLELHPGQLKRERINF